MGFLQQSTHLIYESAMCADYLSLQAMKQFPLLLAIPYLNSQITGLNLRHPNRDPTRLLWHIKYA
jgi:hypothetical protein